MIAIFLALFSASHFEIDTADLRRSGLRFIVQRPFERDSVVAKDSIKPPVLRRALLLHCLVIDQQKAISKKIGLSVPSISWDPRSTALPFLGQFSLTYGLTVDSSDVIAHYSGMIDSGFPLTISETQTEYAKQVTTTATYTTTSYQAFTSGFTFAATPAPVGDSVSVALAVAQSVPTDDNDPPALSATSATLSVTIPIGGFLDVTGLDIDQERRGWGLFSWYRSRSRRHVLIRLWVFDPRAVGAKTAGEAGSEKGIQKAAKPVP